MEELRTASNQLKDALKDVEAPRAGMPVLTTAHGGRFHEGLDLLLRVLPVASTLSSFQTDIFEGSYPTLDR